MGTITSSGPMAIDMIMRFHLLVGLRNLPDNVCYISAWDHFFPSGEGILMSERIRKTSSAFHWQEAAPEVLGMSQSGLERYARWLHSQAEGEPYGTVVARHGKIVCERYGCGASVESRWEIGSIRKGCWLGFT